MVQREPAEENTTEAEAESKALAEEREKAQSYLANWQRAQADFINYKRRSEQEKEESKKSANLGLVLSLLPVLDDFDRAFAAIPPNLEERGWLDGINLVERKLRANLEAQGITAIPTVGKTFDPRFHEAVRQDKGEEGKIIEEVQKGYNFHDRVIRPSKVVVGNGEIEETSEFENNS